MKTKSVNFALFMCVYVLVFCVSAFAESAGFYVGGNAGMIIPSDSTFKETGIGNSNISYKNGYAMSLLAGYKCINNFRFEGELGYKNAKTDTLALNGNAGLGYDSTVSVANLMANVFYDIKTPYTSVVTPYLGGGVGVAVLMTSSGTVRGVGKNVDRSDDTVFAYQVGGGFTFDVTPKVTLDLGYRYFDTNEGSINTTTGTNGKIDFTSHNILLGVRYNF